MKKRFLLGTSLLILAACADLDTAGEPDAGGDAEPAERTIALGADHIEAAARAALDDHFLAGEDVRVGLRVDRVSADPTRAWHARVQQTYEDLPVFEGEAIVHLDEDGAVRGITDKLVRGVSVDVTPALTADEAIARARGGEPAERESEAPQTKLMVFARGRQPTLAYQVRLFRDAGAPASPHHHPSQPVVFVDAHTGEELMRYDDMQTIATGKSLYSGTVTFNAYTYHSGKYYLETPQNGWIIVDGNNGGTSTHFSDSNNYWSATDQRAGVDATIGMNWAAYYFADRFGRNLIDGNGGPKTTTTITGQGKQMSARVHIGMNWENASWNPTSRNLYFGDGDPNDVASEGSPTGPWVSIDTVGHEYTHGVVQYTANLTYAGQSGALNEAFADVFGAMIEFAAYGGAGNWLIGEDYWTPDIPGDALRDLANPHNSWNFGYTSNDNPDHWSERYQGTDDNGGVHINSGIAAKAFYLLAQGGSHPHGGSMTGIGREAAAWVWYVALGWYLTQGSDFSDARDATLSAAAAGYGANGTVYKAVAKSWSLVGVN